MYRIKHGIVLRTDTTRNELQKDTYNQDVILREGGILFFRRYKTKHLVIHSKQFLTKGDKVRFWIDERYNVVSIHKLTIEDED